MKKTIFHGPTHRVQFFSWAIEPPYKYGVYVLPNRYHKSTSFRKCGTQLYYGTSLPDAFIQVLRYAPDAEVPGWAKELVGTA